MARGTPVDGAGVNRLKQGTDHLASAIASAKAAVQQKNKKNDGKNRWNMRGGDHRMPIGLFPPGVDTNKAG
jgi:hypothetical protein